MRRSQAEAFEILTAYNDVLTFKHLPIVALNVDGLGMPPAVVRYTQSPFQHGATFRAAYLEPRLVTVTVHLAGCGRDQYWAVRNTLLETINQYLGPFTFRVRLRDGTKRELRDVMYDAGAELLTVGRSPASLDFAFRMVAYDPVLFGSFAEKTVVPGSGSAKAWEFPLNDPGEPAERSFDTMEFGGGSSMGLVTFQIVYAGNWPSYPIIVVRGPADDMLLTSVTTGEKLELSGYNIAVGEEVTFDTTFGYKTVVSDVNGNIIGWLTDDSNLGTFRLEPHPVAPGGVNEFTFQALNTDADSALVIRYYDRYVGM